MLPHIKHWPRVPRWSMREGLELGTGATGLRGLERNLSEAAL
jgi:hypothetical protein